MYIVPIKIILPNFLQFCIIFGCYFLLERAMCCFARNSCWIMLFKLLFIFAP